MGNKRASLDPQIEAKLVKAIIDHDATGLEKLLAAGIDLEAALKTQRDATPLELALRHNADDVIVVLVKAGADWRKSGLNLSWAAYQKDEGLLRKLIKDGADVNSKGRRGDRPLMVAANLNLPSLMRLLIAAGADVNTDAPLARAVTANFSEAALMLLKAGAVPVKDAGLVSWAVQRGNREVLQALLAAGADINEKSKLAEYDFENSKHVTYYELASPLIVAAGNGHAAMVQDLIAAGANLDLNLYATDDKGATALDYAQQNQHAKVAALLAAAAAKNPRPADPSAELIFAAEKGDAEAVKKLLAAGANPNVRDIRPRTQGFTPLMLAARQGNATAVAALLAARADFALIDEGNSGEDAGFNFMFNEGGLRTVIAANFSMSRTALHWAAAEGHVAAAGLLIPHAADINQGDRAKLTPLHLAALAGAPEIVRELLQAGANAEAAGRGKLTPLHYAARSGSVESAQALIEAGAKVDIKNSASETPLHLAASCAQPGVVELLLKAGADFNTVRKSGDNVIAAAVGHQLFEDKYRDKKMVTLCLRPEADVRETVRLLIEAGADPAAKEKHAFTALDWVHRYLKNSPLFTSLVELLGKSQPRAAAPLAAAKKSKSPKTTTAPAQSAKTETSKKADEPAPRPDFSAAAKRPEFKTALTALEKLCGTKRQPLPEVGGGFTLHVQSGRKVDLEKTQAEFLSQGVFVFSPDTEFDSRIGVLPTTDKYQALLAMQTNGQNVDLMPQDVIAWLQKLEKEQPLVISGAGFDFVRGKFLTIIAKPAALAKRMYEFCPDIVDHGVGDVKLLAEELRKSPAFFFGGIDGSVALSGGMLPAHAGSAQALPVFFPKYLAKQTEVSVKDLLSWLSRDAPLVRLRYMKTKKSTKTTRKIIAITHVTLDGVMQAPGGPEEDPSNGFTYGGWSMSFGDDASGKVIDEIVAGEFGLLLGRRTYEIFAAYWPNHGDNPIGQAFNHATKHVVTRSLGQLDWNNSQKIVGDAVGGIRRLKASAGPELHIWGSSELLQTLITADLVDEFRVWVYPVVLGEGKRLFENGVPPRRLTLVESRSTSDGVVLNTYRPAGPLSKTPVQPEKPSKAELARRKKLAAEGSQRVSPAD